MLGLLLAAPAPARAFVPYRTADKLHTFYWPESCVGLTVYANNFSEIPYAQTIGAVRAAAKTWSTPAVSCTYMNVEVLLDSGTPPHAGNDGRSVMLFRTDRWCRWDDPPESCSYDSSALAITSVFAKGDGHIIDADIEVNAAMGDIRWMNADVMIVPGKHDLQNALTHEMGHFLGFDHTCYKPGANKERQLDDMGNPVPDCDSAPPAVQMTVMFDETTAGETSKRMLSSDDQRAVCTTYPPSLDPNVCSVNVPTDSVGCALAGPANGGDRWPPASVVLVVALSAAVADRRGGRARRARRAWGWAGLRR